MIVSGAKSCLTSEVEPSSEMRLSAKKTFCPWDEQRLYCTT